MDLVQVWRDRQELPLAGWSFLVNTDALFEHYVADVLERELPAFGHRVCRQMPRALYRTGCAGEVRIDLVVYRGARPCLVLDTKYKALADGAAPATQDIYQVMAYCANLDLPVGMIVYPTGSETERDVVSSSPLTIATAPFPLVGDDEACRRGKGSSLLGWHAGRWRSQTRACGRGP